MQYDSNKHHRRSIRRKNYDYSQPGDYFVTICVQNRECLFGMVENQKMILSDIGIAAETCWQNIPEHYPNVRLDEYVIMPNHVHGIIKIVDNINGGSDVVGVQNVGVQNIEPLRNIEPPQPKQNKYQHIIPGSLGSIIRGFKIGVTKWCNRNGYSNFQWQRNFHDHIIRNESELYRIRMYIRNNQKNWDIDNQNPF